MMFAILARICRGEMRLMVMMPVQEFFEHEENAHASQDEQGDLFTQGIHRLRYEVYEGIAEERTYRNTHEREQKPGTSGKVRRHQDQARERKQADKAHREQCIEDWVGHVSEYATKNKQ